jgi:hypothetical protein
MRRTSLSSKGKKPCKFLQCCGASRGLVFLKGIAVGAVASMVIGFSWGAIFATTPVAALAQPGLDPLQMMTNATNLPTAHYVDYSVVFN